MIIKHNIPVIALVCLVIAAFAASPLCSAGKMNSGEPKVMTFGGKAGWKRVVTRQDVAEGKGRFGYSAMMLSTNSRRVDDGTDLLVDFEKRPFMDAASRYDVLTSSLGIANNAAMGSGAGISRGTGGAKGGMLLRGKGNALFGAEGPTGSFYIEFWLNPSVAENGEVVLSWRSSRKSGYAADKYGEVQSSNVLYQIITCSFLNNRLVWDLTNMFDTVDVNRERTLRSVSFPNESVSINGLKNIVPGTWSHHALIYNDENGALEYRVDGMLEDVKYITSTKHEGGTVHPMYLGVPADIEICPTYMGMIDDFHIGRGTREDALSDAAENGTALGYAKYSTSAGRFETEPLLVMPASKMDSLVALMTVPPQTEVRLYVRCGDNFYNWTETYPKWKQVTSGEDIEGMSGMYFQVAADLMSDGRGEVSPSVTELSLHYTERGAPLPPFNVQAVPGDGSVTLRWSYSVDEAAGDYFVYYGTRPGEYLSRTAAEGSSPINAGQTNTLTLTGLRNGTIYYFAVSASSRYADSIQGLLSKEVYARPGQK